MAPDVLDAMREAAGAFVDMAELQSRPAMPSPGTRARERHRHQRSGGGDHARHRGLPGPAGPGPDGAASRHRGHANEVIMFRAHRTGYDHAIRAPAHASSKSDSTTSRRLGVRASRLGDRGRDRTEDGRDRIRRQPTGQPSLAAVAAVARKHDLPVIVDAAAQLPPKPTSRASSPRAALVATAAARHPRPAGHRHPVRREGAGGVGLIQQLDMDILIETGRRPPAARWLLRDRLPHHGIGRGCKVDKESIAGLLVALERFAAADEDEENSRYESNWRPGSADLEARTCLSDAARCGGDAALSILEIRFDERALGLDAAEISRRLQCQPNRSSGRAATPGRNFAGRRIGPAAWRRKDYRHGLVAALKQAP